MALVSEGPLHKLDLMLKSIENLLVLQDWDRKLTQHQNELKSLGPHRIYLKQKLAGAESDFKQAHDQLNTLLSNQKQLELETESQEERIKKYANQQLQTKKNEEYQALEHEMAHCREHIGKLEEKILEIMDAIESGQTDLEAKKAEFEKLKDSIHHEIQDVDKKEQYLKTTISDYTAKRDLQRQSADEAALSLYERLSIKKSGTVLVGIERGVCGGCHMKLTTQAVVTAQGNNEISTCPNCGRILYYLPGMDLTPGD